MADLPATSGAAATWVDVPFSALDGRWTALAPERLTSTLTIPSKVCETITPDSRVVLSVLLGPEPAESIVRVCHSNTGASNVFTSWAEVEWESVRPTEVDEQPTENVIPLAEVDAPEDVIAMLNGLLPET
jgi:hypothetical protein